MRVRVKVTGIRPSRTDPTQETIRVIGEEGAQDFRVEPGSFRKDQHITVEFDGLRYSDPQHMK